MSAGKDSSTLPLLLTLSVAVLVTIGGGWFLLDGDFSLRSDREDSTVAELLVDEVQLSAEATQQQSVAAEVPVLTAGVQADPVAKADTVSVELQIDSNLRKARMAAAADMLVYPEKQSALFYYNSIITVDANHVIARAELETVLAKIGQAAVRHMSAEEYAEAYALAELVARNNPGHSLVRDVTEHFDNLTNVIVEQAMQHAQDGNDDEVVTTLATAEQLPGRNSQYFSAVRESISNIQNSRVTEQETEVEQIRLASLQTTSDWVERVRTAIVDGRLIAPAGDNAVDYLSERDPSSDESVELTNELIGALKSTCAAKIESDLGEADQLLAMTKRYVGDDSDVKALKNSLDQAYIERESATVLSVDRFVRLVATPARYPLRAQERGLTGWVDVLFTVTANGETADIEVQTAEPANLFDSAATTAVEQWTFEPREVRGRVINQRAQARLAFKFE